MSIQTNERIAHPLECVVAVSNTHAGLHRNIQQEGYVELKSWARQPVESLEALLEQPGFGETSFQSLNAPSTKPARVVFDRAKALEGAPAYLAEAFKDLFR